MRRSDCHLASATWGARCGKSARRVLRGGTSTSDIVARSVPTHHPDIVLYTPDGEYRGRQQVMKYMNTAYFQYAPGLRYEMNPHDVRAFGDALWYSYDYRIDVDKAGKHRTGHGVAMCRRVEGKWLVLNMHNAETDSGGATTSH